MLRAPLIRFRRAIIFMSILPRFLHMLAPPTFSESAHAAFYFQARMLLMTLHERHIYARVREDIEPMPTSFAHIAIIFCPLLSLLTTFLSFTFPSLVLVTATHYQQQTIIPLHAFIYLYLPHCLHWGLER